MRQDCSFVKTKKVWFDFLTCMRRYSDEVFLFSCSICLLYLPVTHDLRFHWINMTSLAIYNQLAPR